MKKDFFGKAKTKLAKNYWINPISHYKLFSPVKGECRELTDRCYVLELVSKTNFQDKSQHIVGYWVAEELLEIINKPKLPLINLMSSDVISTKSDNLLTTKKLFINNMTKFNKELYYIIHIIIIAWKITELDGPFKEILSKIANPNLECDVEHWRAKSINTALNNRNTSLDEILFKLKNQYPNMKDFKFPEYNKVLNEFNVL